MTGHMRIDYCKHESQTEAECRLVAEYMCRGYLSALELAFVVSFASAVSVENSRNATKGITRK